MLKQEELGTGSLLSRLRAVPVFRDLEEADLQRLLRGAKERQFQPGALVIREGDIGEEFFLILEGDFQAFLRQEILGLEKELRRLGPGDYFGEIALLTGGKRLASVRAISGGRVLVVDKRQLDELLIQAPGAALALCRSLAGYIERANEGTVYIPFISLDEYPSVKEAHKLISPRIATFCQALVLEHGSGRAKVALLNPQDTRTRSFLQEVLRNYQVEFFAVSEREFERYRNMYLGQVNAEAAAPETLPRLSYINPDGRDESLGQHDTARLLNEVFGQALRLGASDIHFEPGVGNCRVRLRVDGMMMPLQESIPHKLFEQVVSRLKVMSDLDITSRRLPQDGRFPLRAGDQRVEVRVSIIPCQGGEKAVLRILNPRQRKYELDDLMPSRPMALLVKELFLAPSGLLLVCGPTGSGKTTTLYAGLNAIWNKSMAINIVTAEDPVEYQLDYATQVAVNKAAGLDFAQILRSILRQDPDVILVGEIRDEESASIATEAATTGHLVLSSLHCDFALESIARLRNLQVKPYLLAAALRGVISQKLVPRVCRNCAEPISASDEEVARLRQAGILPMDWQGSLYRGRGCAVCRSQGELGRIGVFEVLTVNDPLRDLIEAGAPWAEMKNCLTPDVFIPMAYYSRLLLEEGLVAPERIGEIFPAQNLGEASDRRDW
jgi:general secretion pathway protein E